MKILIVIDMQNDFISGVLGTKEAQAIVPNVKEKIQTTFRDGGQILFTYDSHTDNYLETEEGRNLAIPHCIIGTNGRQIVPEIGRVFKEIMNAPSAKKKEMFSKETFGSMELGKYLENRTDVSEVEVVGLCTDICVISNAMIVKAALPNTHIVVDAACCAGVTPESHDTALAAMKACQIEIRNEGKEPWRNGKGENL